MLESYYVCCFICYGIDRNTEKKKDLLCSHCRTYDVFDLVYLFESIFTCTDRCDRACRSIFKTDQKEEKIMASSTFTVCSRGFYYI